MVYFDMTAFLTFVYLACEKNCSISFVYTEFSATYRTIVCEDACCPCYFFKNR